MTIDRITKANIANTPQVLAMFEADSGVIENAIF
jgi:hypothetical protein